MRVTLAVLVALAAALIVGCGSSGDHTLSVGDGETITIPSGVHGVYGETQAILDAFPYQRWFTDCIMQRVKKEIGPAEAESLSGSEGEEKVTKVIAAARPACEESTDRPTVDPNASSHELALLRAEYATSLVELAESNGLDDQQLSCVEENFAGLPDAKIVAMSNGSHKVREGILVSVVKPCAATK